MGFYIGTYALEQLQSEYLSIDHCQYGKLITIPLVLVSPGPFVPRSRSCQNHCFICNFTGFNLGLLYRTYYSGFLNI